jgi:hypothetical protein
MSVLSSIANLNMRVLLFLVAMAAIVSICRGGNGKCSSSVSKVCAVCQDINSRCAYCKSGYQCQGSSAANCYCSANPAYVCPANCAVCSAPCSGTGTKQACVRYWKPAYGCLRCASGYTLIQSAIPLPTGVAGSKSACYNNNITICT